MPGVVNSPVVVVGGGPGGSAAAISLRRAGLPVVLLDAAHFPRDKVCGDVVLPSAQDAVRVLGLDVGELERASFPCTGALYTTPSGFQLSGGFRDQNGEPRPWWMVKRAVLDAWLLQAARRSGVDVREGWRVVDFEPGMVTARLSGGGQETLRASAVVGADGGGSVIARKARRHAPAPEHTCLAARGYMEDTAPDPPRLEVYTSRRTLPGCAWVVPVGRREANVGIGILQSDARRLSVTPQRLFNEMRSRNPAFSDRLRGVKIGGLSGWWLPGATEGRPLAGEGYVLVGDAGAMVDPFTGHGIHHALHSGIIAGEVLSAAVAAGTVDAASVAPYELRCRAHVLADTASGSRLQRLHANAALVELGVRLCAVHPGLRWLLLSLTGHTAPREQIFRASTLAGVLTGRVPV